jgi:hypothetical protein
MSKVVISFDTEVSNNVLIDIERATANSLTELRQAISSGKPFAEFLLFYNNHNEVEQKLRNLISIFNVNSVEAKFFELEEDEELDLNNRDLTEISSDTLLNILEAHNLGIGRIEGAMD